MMNRRRWIFKAIVVTLLPVAFTGSLFAQDASQADSTESKGDAAYQQHDWASAESLYSSLTGQTPGNARWWYRLGVSARGNRHFDEALKAFARARAVAKWGALPGWLVDYELGRTYAAMGDAPHALDSLKASASQGFAQPAKLDSDVEWSSLRSDPQFVALVNQVKHNAAPCEDEAFRQFDFWIGDWDVSTSVDGGPAGTSHISKEMGGCVIWENWTSSGSGYFGKSYNTYNVNLRRWEQYWVDNSAGTMFFYGNLKDGVMDYVTDDVSQPDGTRLRRHLQFIKLAPDKVRQFSQGSTDGGKSWHVEYDFTYSRHAGEQAVSH